MGTVVYLKFYSFSISFILQMKYILLLICALLLWAPIGFSKEEGHDDHEEHDDHEGHDHGEEESSGSFEVKDSMIGYTLLDNAVSLYDVDGDGQLSLEEFEEIVYESMFSNLAHDP